MMPIFEHLSAPWAAGVFLALVALLALAFLRALRRRRALVPGLALFARTRAQNLPPPPPPRFLDRAFFLRAGLLGLLVLIIAGFAVQSSTPRTRQVAILVDHGLDGQVLGEDGQPVSTVLAKAASGIERGLQAGGGVRVETILAAPAAGRGVLVQSTDLVSALQALRAPGAESDKTAATQFWDEIHVVSPRPPPAEVPTPATTRMIWHTPSFQVAGNAGIVRVWIEPVLPGAAAANVPGVPGTVTRWTLWVDVAAKGLGGKPMVVQWSRSTDGKTWVAVSDPRDVTVRVPVGGGLVGPVEIPEGDYTALSAALVDLPEAGAVTIHRDALALDDAVLLRRSSGGVLRAVVDSTADTAMVRGALAAWNIPADSWEGEAPPDSSPATAPRLFLCDGSSEALARLAVLRQSAPQGSVLPVFLAPVGDLPGLQFENTPARVAETTAVPAGSGEYALLGRQPWRIESLRAAKLAFGGTVVVQSPVGPAVVRWLDPQARPAWAILFDPAQSTLANRHAAAWLALWDVIAADAGSLGGDNAFGHAGWTWRGSGAADVAAGAANPLDRRLTLLASSPGREVVLSEGGAATGGEPAGSGPLAAGGMAGAQTWSLSAAAATLAVVFLFWIVASIRRTA